MRVKALNLYFILIYYSTRKIKGILYALRTGIPWRDLSTDFGSWSAVYSRFRRWSQKGLWDRILEALNNLFCDEEYIMVSLASIMFYLKT